MAEKAVERTVQKTNEKRPNSIVAIIDIGSNEIRMRIAERNKSGMVILENMKYPLSLAKDTFGKGSISFGKANKLCDVLVNFMAVCKEYGVEAIKAVSTTALREATNKEYIIDQIKIKTGLDVRILDDNTEKLYIFKLMDYYLLENNISGSLLMGHIGSGSAGVGYSENGSTAIIQSLKIGALRISELFDRVHDNTMEFHIMLEEYLDTYVKDLRLTLNKDISNFAVSGNEALLIADLCNGYQENLMYYVNRDDFLSLYNDIKYKSLDMQKEDYGVPDEKVYTLLPAMSIYKSLLEFTKSDSIIIPIISLAEVLAFEFLFPDEFSGINKIYAENTLMSAKLIAEKYTIPESHYIQVMDTAGKIFDKMKKVHGMGKRNKLLLQMAAILHDCGKFVNVTDHHIHSYNLIKGSNIAGLTYDETDIVANIALYHSHSLPTKQDDNYRELKASKKVLVSKLTAILRLADALDRSRKQKLSDIDVKLTESSLIITAAAIHNVGLEQWAFREKGEFFEEVFGIQPVLKIRKSV